MIVSRNYEIVSRNFEIITRNICRNCEKISRNYEIKNIFMWHFSASVDYCGLNKKKWRKKIFKDGPIRNYIFPNWIHCRLGEGGGLVEVNQLHRGPLVLTSFQLFRHTWSSFIVEAEFAFLNKSSLSLLQS